MYFSKDRIGAEDLESINFLIKRSGLSVPHERDKPSSFFRVIYCFLRLLRVLRSFP